MSFAPDVEPPGRIQEAIGKKRTRRAIPPAYGARTFDATTAPQDNITPIANGALPPPPRRSLPNGSIGDVHPTSNPSPHFYAAPPSAIAPSPATTTSPIHFPNIPHINGSNSTQEATEHSSADLGQASGNPGFLSIAPPPAGGKRGTANSASNYTRRLPPPTASFAANGSTTDPGRVPPVAASFQPISPVAAKLSSISDDTPLFTQANSTENAVSPQARPTESPTQSTYTSMFSPLKKGVDAFDSTSTTGNQRIVPTSAFDLFDGEEDDVSFGMSSQTSLHAQEVVRTTQATRVRSLFDSTSTVSPPSAGSPAPMMEASDVTTMKETQIQTQTNDTHSNTQSNTNNNNTSSNTSTTTNTSNAYAAFSTATTEKLFDDTDDAELFGAPSVTSESVAATTTTTTTHAVNPQGLQENSKIYSSPSLLASTAPKKSSEIPSDNHSTAMESLEQRNDTFPLPSVPTTTTASVPTMISAAATNLFDSAQDDGELDLSSLPVAVTPSPPPNINDRQQRPESPSMTSTQPHNHPGYNSSITPMVQMTSFVETTHQQVDFVQPPWESENKQNNEQSIITPQADEILEASNPPQVEMTPPSTTSRLSAELIGETATAFLKPQTPQFTEAIETTATLSSSTVVAAAAAATTTTTTTTASTTTTATNPSISLPIQPLSPADDLFGDADDGDLSFGAILAAAPAVTATTAAMNSLHSLLMPNAPSVVAVGPQTAFSSTPTSNSSSNTNFTNNDTTIDTAATGDAFSTQLPSEPKTESPFDLTQRQSTLLHPVQQQPPQSNPFAVNTSPIVEDIPPKAFEGSSETVASEEEETSAQSLAPPASSASTSKRAPRSKRPRHFQFVAGQNPAKAAGIPQPDSLLPANAPPPKASAPKNQSSETTTAANASNSSSNLIFTVAPPATFTPFNFSAAMNADTEVTAATTTPTPTAATTTSTSTTTTTTANPFAGTRPISERLASAEDAAAKAKRTLAKGLSWFKSTFVGDGDGNGVIDNDDDDEAEKRDGMQQTAAPNSASLPYVPFTVSTSHQSSVEVPMMTSPNSGTSATFNDNQLPSSDPAPPAFPAIPVAPIGSKKPRAARPGPFKSTTGAPSTTTTGAPPPFSAALSSDPSSSTTATQISMVPMTDASPAASRVAATAPSTSITLPEDQPFQIATGLVSLDPHNKTSIDENLFEGDIFGTSEENALSATDLFPKLRGTIGERTSSSIQSALIASPTSNSSAIKIILNGSGDEASASTPALTSSGNFSSISESIQQQQQHHHHQQQQQQQQLHENEVKRLTAQISSLQMELEHVKANAHSLQNQQLQHQPLQPQLESTVSSQAAQIKFEQDSNRQLQDRISHLNLQLSQALERASKAEETLITLEKAHSKAQLEWRQKLAELELSSTTKSDRAHNQELEARISQLESYLHDARREIATATSRADSAESESLKWKSKYESEYETLKKTSRIYEDKQSRLEEALAAQKVDHARLVKQLEGQIADLKRALESPTVLPEVEKRHAEEVAKIVQENERYVSLMQQQAASQTSVIDRLIHQNADLVKAVEFARRVLQESKNPDSLGGIMADNDRLQEELESAHSELTALRQRNSELEAKANHFESESEELLRRLNSIDYRQLMTSSRDIAEAPGFSSLNTFEATTGVPSNMAGTGAVSPQTTQVVESPHHTPSRFPLTPQPAARPFQITATQSTDVTVTSSHSTPSSTPALPNAPLFPPANFNNPQATTTEQLAQPKSPFVVTAPPGSDDHLQHHSGISLTHLAPHIDLDRLDDTESADLGSPMRDPSSSSAHMSPGTPSRPLKVPPQRGIFGRIWQAVTLQ